MKRKKGSVKRAEKQIDRVKETTFLKKKRYDKIFLSQQAERTTLIRDGRVDTPVEKKRNPLEGHFQYGEKGKKRRRKSRNADVYGKVRTWA